MAKLRPTTKEDSRRVAGRRSGPPAQSDTVFQGFPPACFKFLRDLTANNNRVWFQAHRDEFESNVLAPSRAFVIAAGSAMKQVYPSLLFDSATGGSGSMFRLARDIRFTRDKSPYKTNLGFRFWLSQRARAAGRAGIYINVAPKGIEVYGGAHGLTPQDIAAFRRRLTQGSRGAELQRILDRLGVEQFRLHGDAVTRVPSGIARDHPQAELAKFKSLMMVSPVIGVRAAGSAGLIEDCVDYAVKMKSLNEWFSSVFGD